MPVLPQAVVSPLKTPDDGKDYIPHFLPNDQHINIGTKADPDVCGHPGHGNSAGQVLRALRPVWCHAPGSGDTSCQTAEG